jgi:hypothetical protein
MGDAISIDPVRKDHDCLVLRNKDETDRRMERTACEIALRLVPLRNLRSWNERGQLR